MHTSYKYTFSLRSLGSLCTLVSSLLVFSSQSTSKKNSHSYVYSACSSTTFCNTNSSYISCIATECEQNLDKCCNFTRFSCNWRLINSLGLPRCQILHGHHPLKWLNLFSSVASQELASSSLTCQQLRTHSIHHHHEIASSQELA